ncbi:membrane hypothetical protein [Plantibacter sp. T3]|nr:membrane hypothetical protein [Plantibacter sp. T3]
MPWRIAFALLLAISILGGLKSGIVGLATTLIVISVVMTGRQMYIHTAIARYWWVAAAGLAYGAAVAASYVTYQRMGGSFLGSIFDRLTVIGAEPKRIALLGEVAVPTGGVVSDFLYFLTKYTGGDVSGRYTLERAVSAKIIGVDPASNAWTTPVTVGAIPEVVLFFGPILAIVLCVLIGLAMRQFTKIAASGFWRMSSIGVAALMFFTWMSRGGLAYYVTNYAIVTLLLFGTCYAVYLFSSDLEQRFRKLHSKPAKSRNDVDLGAAR